MQNRTRSLLAELDEIMVQRDRENVVESRANNIINGAINLLEFIYENYDQDKAAELERRMLNAIKGREAAKFSRAVRKMKK